MAYGLVVFLIVCVAYVLFLNVKGEPAFVFGYSAMWVKTPSMEPVIPEKSYILVQKIDAKDVKKGDIIVFYSDDPTLNNSLNTHQVVGIVKGDDGKTEFITKGKNNPNNDLYTAKADKVVGKYQRKLPVMTSFGRFLSTAVGITVMLFIILLVTLATFIPGMIESIRKKSKNAAIDEITQDELEKLKSRESENRDEE